MKITERPDEFPLHDPVDRAPGCHLMQVVNDLNNIIYPKQAYPEWDSMSAEDQRQTLLLWETGFLWEDVCSLAFGSRLAERPGQICVDGIWCSADGVDYEEGIIHEYKATWGSMAKGIESRWRWMMQAKGYCHAYGMTAARFHVLWICGDYGRPIKPKYKSYDVEFGAMEVQESWRLVLNHAKKKGWV